MKINIDNVKVPTLNPEGGIIITEEKVHKTSLIKDLKEVEETLWQEVKRVRVARRRVTDKNVDALKTSIAFLREKGLEIQAQEMEVILHHAERSAPEEGLLDSSLLEALKEQAREIVWRYLTKRYPEEFPISSPAS